MKRILITGATGFLGRYLVNVFLVNKYEVIATGRNINIGQELVRDGASFIPCDLVNKHAVLSLI